MRIEGDEGGGGGAGDAFDSEAELLESLRAQGMEHVSRWSLTAVAPWVDLSLQSQVRQVTSRRRFIDVVSEQGRARWEAEAQPSPKLKASVPLIARRLLEAERASCEQARASEAERLTTPEDARTHRVHGLLCELRRNFPKSISPRPLNRLMPDRLAFSDEAPVVGLESDRGAELPEAGGPGFILPRAELSFSRDAVLAKCTCGAKACVHALALVDTLLVWLHQPVSELTARRLDGLLLPSWERTLRALERAVEEGPSGIVEVSWRIDVLGGYGVLVTPYAHRRTKSGVRSAGARVSRRKLLHEHAGELSARDLRVAAMLPDGDGPATRALLLELIDHPSVQLNDRPELSVRVDRARVGLIALDRGEVVQLAVGVDGAPLPPPLLEKARRAEPEEALFLWDDGARRLTVLDLNAELRSVLGVLKRHDAGFPRESVPALLDRLSRLSMRMPVAMPRSVMGESIAAQEAPLVRLEGQPTGAVIFELRVRPLPDGPSFVPGEGPRDVHVRRGAQAFHAVRDFARERAMAEGWMRRLPLQATEEEDGPYRRRFAAAAGALELVKACAHTDPRPELEWVGKPLRTLSAAPAQLRITLEKRREWFGALGGLAVEGERVELARLIEAARKRDRYVQVSATTYLEIEEALREHLTRLADHAHHTRHGLEFGPSAVEALNALEAAGAQVQSDAAWQTLVQRIFAANEGQPKIPRGLKATLRDYQVDGFRWLSRLAAWGAGGVLADDMGLGKTVQTLALLLQRAAAGPSLVVAPTSVAFNWLEEAARFAPALRLRLYSDADDRGRLLERLKANDVLVVSYGLLARDIERLAAVPFATAVFDEAQILKNAGTQRFRAARSLQAGFKVALSGTPLENHLGELWALFAVVFPPLLGSWEAFRTRFAGPIERRVDPTAAPALARVLAPFMLRRTKAQVETQLPPRTEIRVPVVLSQEEFTLYEDARLAALSDLETSKAKLKEQERRVQVLAALTRLRLLASHPRLFDPKSALTSSKLERLLQLVSELSAEGHRALVFSQFTTHLALVREALEAQGISYEYLDGQTPRRERAERVKAFQEGDAALFLISLKAGGFGLNLTAATTVIHLDPWWNPAVEDQASDRAHRIGQTKPVTIYRLVARGTIEERILTLHEDKRTLVAEVLEGKDRAGRLSTQELLGLLSDRVPDEADAAAAGTRH